MEVLVNAILSAVLLLAITGVVLFLFKRKIGNVFQVKPNQIAILETKFIPRTGQVSVITVMDRSYLIVANTHAICVVPVETKSSSDMPSLGIEP